MSTKKEQLPGNIRSLWFRNPHMPNTKRKPDKKLKAFFNRLSGHALKLKYTDKSVGFYPFAESVKLDAKQLGKRSHEFEFGRGVIAIGVVANTTNICDDCDIFYAFYLCDADSVVSFCAVPKGKKVKFTFGFRDNDFFISATRKKGWKELDFENQKIYDCVIRHGCISRNVSGEELPPLDFRNVGVDEEQQMDRANESWQGTSRILVLYHSVLYLR